MLRTGRGSCTLSAVHADMSFEFMVLQDVPEHAGWPCPHRLARHSESFFTVRRMPQELTSDVGSDFNIWEDSGKRERCRVSTHVVHLISRLLGTQEGLGKHSGTYQGKALFTCQWLV